MFSYKYIRAFSDFLFFFFLEKHDLPGPFVACPHLEGAGVHISIFKHGSKRGPCRLLVRTPLWAVGTWAHALCGSWWSCGCCGRKAASPPGLSTEAGNLTFYVKHPNLEVLQKAKVARNDQVKEPGISGLWTISLEN